VFSFFFLAAPIPPVSVYPKRFATLTRMQGGQRHVISWMDAPDDVFFKASPVIYFCYLENCISGNDLYCISIKKPSLNFQTWIRTQCYKNTVLCNYGIKSILLNECLTNTFFLLQKFSYKCTGSVNFNVIFFIL